MATSAQYQYGGTARAFQQRAVRDAAVSAANSGSAPAPVLRYRTSATVRPQAKCVNEINGLPHPLVMDMVGSTRGVRRTWVVGWVSTTSPAMLDDFDRAYRVTDGNIDLAISPTEDKLPGEQ